MYCKDLLVKNPDNQILGIFYQSWYCKDHINQGPDNQGLDVDHPSQRGSLTQRLGPTL